MTRDDSKRARARVWKALGKTDSYGGALFATPDGETRQRFFGKARRDKDVTADTRHRIFSLSKAINAVAALILVDEGRLKLHAHIGIGELTTLHGHRQVTLLELLDHRSGLFNAVNYVFFDRKPEDVYAEIMPEGALQTNALSITNIIKVINDHGGSDDPDARRNRSKHGTFAYCNTNYDIVGYIIDCVTGGRAKEFIKERIFKKLEMDADFMEDADLLKETTAWPFNMGDDGVREWQGAVNGNANIVSTLEGYMRFLRGYRSLLEAETVDKFHKLYFFQMRSKKLYFYSSGSGDFPKTQGKVYRALTKSVVIYSVDDDPTYYANRNMDPAFENTIMWTIICTLFPDIIGGAMGDVWWGSDGRCVVGERWGFNVVGGCREEDKEPPTELLPLLPPITKLLLPPITKLLLPPIAKLLLPPITKLLLPPITKLLPYAWSGLICMNFGSCLSVCVRLSQYVWYVTWWTVSPLFI